MLVVPGETLEQFLKNDILRQLRQAALEEAVLTHLGQEVNFSVITDISNGNNGTEEAMLPFLGQTLHISHIPQIVK